MDSVFIMWHVHQLRGEPDEKLIGVYKTRADAERAIERLRDKVGFRDTPDGFEIHEYTLGTDDWTEGFISEAEAMDEFKS